MASRSLVKAEPVWRESMKRGAVRTSALAGGMALLLLALLLVLALASYKSSDPSMMTAAAGPARNLVGGVGAWTADLLLSFFGPAIAQVWPKGSFSWP